MTNKDVQGISLVRSSQVQKALRKIKKQFRLIKDKLKTRHIYFLYHLNHMSGKEHPLAPQIAQYFVDHFQGLTFTEISQLYQIYFDLTQENTKCNTQLRVEMSKLLANYLRDNFMILDENTTLSLDILIDFGEIIFKQLGEGEKQIDRQFWSFYQNLIKQFCKENQQNNIQIIDPRRIAKLMAIFGNNRIDNQVCHEFFSNNLQHAFQNQIISLSVASQLCNSLVSTQTGYEGLGNLIKNYITERKKAQVQDLTVLLEEQEAIVIFTAVYLICQSQEQKGGKFQSLLNRYVRLNIKKLRSSSLFQLRLINSQAKYALDSDVREKVISYCDLYRDKIKEQFEVDDEFFDQSDEE